MFGKRQEIDMIHGPLAGKILLFAIPLMLSSILQLLFNAADVVVVGRFAGDNSLAAVGSTSSLVALTTKLFIGLAAGVNVVAAKELGKGDKEHVRDVVHTAVTVGLVSGVFLLVLGLAISGVVLEMMSSPAEVIELAKLYLRIYFCGMPFLMMYNFGSALLRSMGDTKRPLYFLLFAGVINVILNCIFVICLKMDVAGVALATVISEGISAGLILYCLCTDSGVLRLDLKHLYVNGTFLKQIARVGVPTGIQGMLFSFSNVLIQSSINSLGAVTMAASAATLNIGEFTYMSANSFYQTVLSFDAQNMGAKQYDRIDRINVLCIGYMLVVGGIMSVGTCCLGPQILGIFTTSSEVIEVGMKIMHWYILPFVLCGMMDVLSGCVRGMGFSVMPMVATLMGSCLMRVIWVLFIFPTNPTVSTLFLSYPITWILTGTTHFMCLLVVRKRIRRL